MVPCSILHRQYQESVVFISSWKNSFLFYSAQHRGKESPCTVCCTDPFPLPSWPGQWEVHMAISMWRLTILILLNLFFLTLQLHSIWLCSKVLNLPWLVSSDCKLSCLPASDFNCNPAPHFQTLTHSFLSLHYWSFPNQAISIPHCRWWWSESFNTSACRATTHPLSMSNHSTWKWAELSSYISWLFNDIDPNTELSQQT